MAGLIGLGRKKLNNALVLNKRSTDLSNQTARANFDMQEADNRYKEAEASRVNGIVGNIGLQGAGLAYDALTAAPELAPVAETAADVGITSAGSEGLAPVTDLSVSAGGDSVAGAVGDSISGAASSAADSIGAGLSSAGETIGGLASAAGDAIGTAASAIGTGLSSAAGSVASAISGGAAAAGSAIGGAASALAAGAAAAGGAAASAGSAALSALVALLL